MRNDFDPEDALKRYRDAPSSRVKKSVLSAFGHMFGGRDFHDDTVGFWKKPIPLYMVASSLMIVVGLSFFAGLKASRPGGRSVVQRELTQERDIPTAQDITWTITQRDVL